MQQAAYTHRLDNTLDPREQRTDLTEALSTLPHAPAHLLENFCRLLVHFHARALLWSQQRVLVRERRAHEREKRADGKTCSEKRASKRSREQTVHSRNKTHLHHPR